MRNFRTAHRGLMKTALLATLVGLPIAACSTDDLLTVPDPDVASPGSVTGKTALSSIFAAAVGDFALAYSGNGATEGQIQYSGLLSDELINTESFPTRVELDQRLQTPAAGGGGISTNNSNITTNFRDLSRARVSAERSAAAYAANDSANSVSRAEVLALAGFTYLMFAENWCSGVPFSTYTDAATYGSPETTNQILARARAKFDTAYAVATTAGSANMQNLARVGLGRTLLNLALYDSAAKAVNAVPTTFIYSVLHAENTARENNGIWAFAINARRWSVANNEGTNGLPYRSEGDTIPANAANFDIRVANRRNSASGGLGFDATNPLYIPLKYRVRSSGAILADGVEARLIEAEAAFNGATVAGTNNGGNGGTGYTSTLGILNFLRSQIGTIQPLRAAVCTGIQVNACTPSTGTLPALTPAVGTAAQRAQLFKERAYWLYLTSHRLGDLRRLARPTTTANNQPAGYGLGANAVFPTGAYHKGGNYGNDTAMLLPFEEFRNTNFQGCLAGI